MHQIYLLAGGNIDNTSDKFKKLFLYLSEHIGTIEFVSHYYTSTAWGYVSEHAFVNVALIVNTTLTPEAALCQCLKIEQLMGRLPHEKNQYADRTMDIDIIFYDDMVINTPHLQVPHPRMHIRNFVLTPLAEICPEKIHPILNQTVSALKKDCPDKAVVQQIDL